MAHYVLEASSWIQDAIEGYRDLRRSMKLRAERRTSYKQTYKELSKLNDYELNDIGISRGDIRSIANDTWEDNNRRDSVRMNSNLRGFV